MRAPERTHPVRALVAAASFLTRLPLGAAAGRVSEGDLRAGAAWFPAVGAFVGLLGASAGWLVAHRAPAALAAVVAVAIETAVTGAFHLDGLADTADGLGAASSGRDGLRVMRDPTIGAFGATALVLDLALRIAAVAALLASPVFPWAIVAAAGTARVAPLVLARALPYLRSDGGSGSWVGQRLATTTLAFGSAIGIGVAFVAGAASAAGIVVTVAVVTFAVGGIARRCFGGATGDVFGAAAELSQTLGLVAVVVIAGR
ncbi:MAG: adenosylcobinamide-GDP ribazoletransferase [Actinomycetota bacterium]